MPIAVKRGQRGQTLVELLIGLAITAIVLGALSGVLYTVSDRYSRWAGRVDQAGHGGALAASLQADSHRYLPCAAGAGTLDLVSPLLGTVRYSGFAADSAYVVTRQAPGQGTAVWIERYPAEPTFALTPGTIHVSATGAPDVYVFFHPQPWSCP